jgi:hypothetical protein
VLTLSKQFADEGYGNEAEEDNIEFVEAGKYASIGF